jgi:hypothetical protein
LISGEERDAGFQSHSSIEEHEFDEEEPLKPYLALDIR